MAFKHIWKFHWAFIIFGMVSSALGDTNPCASFISVIDRPTVGDSVCVVPLHKVVIETGYQYQKLTHKAGYQQNFPEAELRLGLPANNEFFTILPNYIHQSTSPHSGYAATTLGIKHQFGYTTNWATALVGQFTLPSGSTAFGNKGLGATVNGIVSYTFNPQYNLTFILGGSTQTDSSTQGGHRFTSINPDLIFTYSLNPQVDMYAEVYGRSKTESSEGYGSNWDAGVIYLLLPSLAIDLEWGQRINGDLGGFNYYIGTGVSVEF